MRSITVGYSARNLLPDADWNSPRNLLYLINRSVVLPKSVDSNVWDEPYCDFFAGPVRLPLPYWNDLSRLDATLSLVDSNYLTTIAITICGGRSLPQSVENLPADPIEFPADRFSFFLGYDIADEGLTSGLSNCGYKEEDRETIAGAFGPFLNEHGLFTEFAEANSFKLKTNIRVPEHAPFFVYAIFSDKNLSSNGHNADV